MTSLVTSTMRMAQFLRVVRSRNTNAGLKMIIKAEIIDADAAKGTSLTLLFTLTSKQNITERHLRAPILHSFKQGEVEVDLGKYMKPQLIRNAKRKMPQCQ